MAAADETEPELVGPPGTVKLTSRMMAGMLIKKVAPTYPSLARAEGITGTVLLSTLIGKDGTIMMLKPISGPEELRKAALDAAQKWRYKPYLVNGQPTVAQTTIMLIFNLGR